MWRCIFLITLLLGDIGFETMSSALAADDAPPPLAVAVEDALESVQLSIAPARREDTKVFVLGEPNRVIIDIVAAPRAPSREFVPPHNPLISAVRFGDHPGKTRLVADIKTKDIPTPTLVETATGLAVVLPVSAELRAAFNAETRNVAGLDVAPPPKTEETGGPAITGGQQLTELAFERLPGDGAPVVRLGLTERPAFSFQKADSKTYRVTLPNCGVAGAKLAFPQYPPDDFIGFTLVEIRQAGADTEVLVGVDRDFKIAPTSTENAIIIRSVPRG